MVYVASNGSSMDSEKLDWSVFHLTSHMHISRSISPRLSQSKFHRTKSRVSVFLKRNGNMQFHVSDIIYVSRKRENSSAT